MKGYPAWFPGLIIASIIVLFLTGCLLTPTFLDLRLEWDMPWMLSSVQRIYTVAIHVLFSYLMLGLLGAIWKIHVLAGMRLRQNLYSGLGLISILIALTITGIGVFYLGNDTASLVASISHILLGVIIMMFFICHAMIHAR